MTKVIAFDLDDTLYPEKEYVFSGFKAVSELVKRRLDIEDFYPELVKTFNGGERKKTFDTTLRRLGIESDEALIQDLVDCYRVHFPDINPYADVVPTLRHLHLTEKYHLALITDGNLQAQKNKVRALNIGQFFEKIIYTDQYGKEYWKPSSSPFQLVMKYFSAEGDECVYIGDNMEKDFIGPNRLGWLTVQIKREEGQYVNSIGNDNHKPQVRIDSLKSLEKILEKGHLTFSKDIDYLY